MRMAFTALLVATLPWLAAGCSNGGENPEDKPGGGTITSEKIFREEQKRVLLLLETFEKHDMVAMDEAVAELEEMASAEKHLISPEIQEQLKKYRDPRQTNNAVDRLRWISKFARSMLLLEGWNKEKWQHCHDMMVRLGPEALVRFTGVLIVKFNENQEWCGLMLMDLCVSHKGIIHDAILEALALKGSDQPGPFQMRVLDDVSRRGLVAVLLGSPDPPVSKIRESATNILVPKTTRRAWAAKLPELKEGGVCPPWVSELLSVQVQADPEWEVRATAADSLGRTGDAEHAVPVLTKALKDKDTWVRRNTCISLGLYTSRAKPAIGPMLEMLKALETEKMEFKKDDGSTELRPLGNPRREIENVALMSLQLISGKRFNELHSFYAWWDERDK
ncbi:MAG: HEAT repeat domain-containing protein [Planctomycetota bacterium]